MNVALCKHFLSLNSLATLSHLQPSILGDLINGYFSNT